MSGGAVASKIENKTVKDTPHDEIVEEVVTQDKPGQDASNAVELPDADAQKDQFDKQENEKDVSGTSPQRRNTDHKPSSRAESPRAQLRRDPEFQIEI